MSTEVVYVEHITIDWYRRRINRNPNNQLAPFGAIMGLGIFDGRPEFHPQAGDIQWDVLLGANNRPVQPLVGADNPVRKLYRVHREDQSFPVLQYVSWGFVVMFILGICWQLKVSHDWDQQPEPYKLLDH
eukprot:TRINITY_DN4120_c0_g2_i2.p1 TRINITY_DN4120_c0_g2~~TRINITY_DN4120_c0_g2_i2.p1  ORF type:complete len:130 (+),score=7.14 TRINITY_DN4120_c0_g2_i2:206-595(+)